MNTTPDPQRPSTVRTVVWFALFTLACLVVTMGYVMGRLSRAGDSAVSAPESTAVLTTASEAGYRALNEIRGQPHVYYRSVRGAEFGRVVVAALDLPNDRRVVTDLACDRVDFGRQRGMCLAERSGPLGRYALAQVVDRDFVVRGAVELPGRPIRTRLSPDERYAAATVFVTGERYDSDFTTRTTIIDMQTGTSLGDLEQFTTVRDGRAFRRVDFNFWGVTFRSDSRRFYATLGTMGSRLLIEGDVSARQLRVVRENVECPSVSPDGRQIAFKSRLPGTGEWRLHLLNVAAESERAITQEGRSIDDQIEWLDAQHVLYEHAADRGLPEDAVHVWVSPVSPDDHTPPAVFIRAASSPAVVNP